MPQLVSTAANIILGIQIEKKLMPAWGRYNEACLKKRLIHSIRTVSWIDLPMSIQSCIANKAGP